MCCLPAVAQDRKRSISVDTALRLSKFFGTTPEFWINIQTQFDLENKKEELAEDLSRIQKVSFPASGLSHAG